MVIILLLIWSDFMLELVPSPPTKKKKHFLSGRFTGMQIMSSRWHTSLIAQCVVVQRFGNVPLLKWWFSICFSSDFSNCVVNTLEGFCKRICCEWKRCRQRKSLSCTCSSRIPYWLRKKQARCDVVFPDKNYKFLLLIWI